jgi:hypothetical protein
MGHPTANRTVLKTEIIMRISFLAGPLVILSLLAASPTAGALGNGEETSPPSKTLAQVPTTLIGQWNITRELPTTAITCWDSREARYLLGKHFQIGPGLLIWGHTQVPIQNVRETTFDDESFLRAYSGSGGSVRFRYLGVTSPTAKVVEIRHPDIKWKDPGGQDHYEIPGEWALLKAPNTIVVSVCNVYYEARRLPAVKQH